MKLWRKSVLDKTKGCKVRITSLACLRNRKKAGVSGATWGKRSVGVGGDVGRERTMAGRQGLLALMQTFGEETQLGAVKDPPGRVFCGERMLQQMLAKG